MIWARKKQNEDGMYVDGSSVRWVVDWVHKLYCPCGLSEAEHGYERFETVDAACAAWGLTPWVDPEQEELLINDFTEND